MATACVSDLAPIDDYRLPPPDTSLDPAALRVGDVVYACGHWSTAGRPSEPRILVDLYFGRRTVADPEDAPRQASLDAVTRAGGTLLFVFGFPAARVRIDTDRIPGLGADGTVSYAQSVPDPRRYDWETIVAFTRPVTAADSVAFTEAGGVVRYIFTSINAIAGDLPNRSIVAYRTHGDVSFVEAGGIGCVESSLVRVPG